MSDVGSTDMRDGCFKCGGNPRPKLVPRGQWIVCEKCGGSYGEAAPGNIAHLAAPQAPAAPAEARRWHELKTDPEPYDAVASGAKTHEIRKDDRGFRVGDGLWLRRTMHSGAEIGMGSPLVYTGEECRRVVSHIQRGYGLAGGWVILSLAAPQAPAAPAEGAYKGMTGHEIEAAWQRDSGGGLFDPSEATDRASYISGILASWQHFRAWSLAAMARGS